MEIGNKIMELRKKNNLSQEELAEKIEEENPKTFDGIVVVY